MVSQICTEHDCWSISLIPLFSKIMLFLLGLIFRTPNMSWSGNKQGCWLNCILDISNLYWLWGFLSWQQGTKNAMIVVSFQIQSTLQFPPQLLLQLITWNHFQTQNHFLAFHSSVYLYYSLSNAVKLGYLLGLPHGPLA